MGGRTPSLAAGETTCREEVTCPGSAGWDANPVPDTQHKTLSLCNWHLSNTHPQTS